MECKIINNKKSFTLVEILLYLAILGIVLVAISSFLLVLLQIKSRNQTVDEVDSQGAQIMQLITDTIRNSTGVTVVSSSQISLQVSDSAKNPTIFDLSSSTVRIKEGTGSYVTLTSNRVQATNLVFTNYLNAGTKASIRVELTLNHINTSGKSEFSYTRTFYGTGSLR